MLILLLNVTLNGINQQKINVNYVTLFSATSYTSFISIDVPCISENGSG